MEIPASGVVFCEKKKEASPKNGSADGTQNPLLPIKGSQDRGRFP